MNYLDQSKNNDFANAFVFFTTLYSFKILCEMPTYVLSSDLDPNFYESTLSLSA